MTKKKIAVKHEVRLRPWRVIREAVERGATFGVRRGLKYKGETNQELLAESIADEIMIQLDEVIQFPEES